MHATMSMAEKSSMPRCVIAGALGFSYIALCCVAGWLASILTG